MKLEWFRHHKKFVYWVLLPVVGIGTAFFGATAALERGGIFSGKRGPSINYHVADSLRGDSVQYMNPAEVLAYRSMLAKYARRREASSQEVARHLSQYNSAIAQGFEVGQEETQESLRKAVQQRTQQPDATQEIYGKLLQTMSMTPNQFEKMNREETVIQKYVNSTFQDLKISDAELFPEYCKDKEVVRIRYKEFKSEDYIAKAETPAEDKVKEFYEKNKTNVKELKDVMFTKPKISADIIFLDTEKLFGDIKPTDEELKKSYDQFKGTMFKIEPKAGDKPAADGQNYKPFESVKAEVEAKWKEEEVKKYYERNKRIYWMITPKAGEKAPPAGEEKVKPFDEVKAEAETKWKKEWEGNEKTQRAMARMNKLKQDIVDAESAWAASQESKPEKDRKPFDLGDWAKKQNLVHWETDELTQDQFQQGKEEVLDKKASWPARLFSLYEETQYNTMNDYNKRQQKEFGYPIVVSKGVVMQRPKKYIAEDPKPLADAHDAIVARMKVYSAIDLAKKDADKVRDDWDRGKDVPAIDTLDEVSGDSTSRDSIVKEFFETPKAIGEVLPVAEGSAEPNNPMSKNPNERFYVGFAVERQTPSYAKFVADTEWDRDQKRYKVFQTHAQFIDRTISAQKLGDALGDDQPLTEEFRRGSKGPIDDY